jgi:hypothetical protein
MSDSTLSFNASSSFRNNLMGRNLQPYNVPGAYSPPSGDVNYEVSPLSDSPIIDSPNDLIGTTVQANQLYPLNEYGPEGGYSNIISTDGAPLPVDSNQGEYGQSNAQIDLVNEFYIDSAYLKNSYGPESGYKDMIIITDIITNQQLFLPYANNGGFPLTFNPSSYSPIQILLEDNPQGSNGLLSQDSELAQRGALALREEFQRRIELETQQLVSSVFQLDQLQDPFEASLVATGQQPLIGKNWKITVPENPLLAAVAFANRLTGTYFPVSPIPGDYFNDTEQVLSPQTENALNVANNLTGGLLGPILNKYRNPSETFVANTGYGQKSVLFKSLDYNIYRPKYNKGLILGVTDAISNLLGANTTQGGGYYVGSDQAEPSMISSPPNEVPVDRFGKQQQAPVYGPSDLAKLYEGNIDKIKFGLKGKSYSDQGGITGQFTWVSPKYKDNLGFKVKPGGDPVQPQDKEFNSVKFEFNDDTESTGFEFKGGSILDNTQKLIESADSVTGIKRLEHVGNAINQVSKVFNDGYKELTKGSRVIAYYDSVTNSDTISIDGIEVGQEYCRLFQKDTPYLTYGDLQKRDGITTSGRRFNNSVLDNTYNLNIAPLRLPDSTNIKDGKVKKYMFSLENLAWRTSSEPGFTYDDLPICERGPNGGRIMWFPPYDLKFSDSSTASWNETSFLGRPEPIYTYKNTKRSGTLSWTIIVDSPASMNTIIEKQLANFSPEQVDSIMDSFFAGCVKYDLYDLAAKFNQIPISELYTYQELLQNPRLTDEEKNLVLSEIPVISKESTNKANTTVTNANGGANGTDSNGAGTQSNNDTKKDSVTSSTLETSFNEYIGYAFYFDNDCPICGSSTLTKIDTPYTDWYNIYLNQKSTYTGTYPPEKVKSGNAEFSRDGIGAFFDDVVIGNFEKIKSDFLPVKLKEALVDLEGTVTIEFKGSASAPASNDYNDNLSQRRNSTVENWFKKQTIGDRKVTDWIKSGKLKLKFTAKGEELSIPKSGTKDGDNPSVTNYTLKDPIDCTTNIIDTKTNTVTGKSQWYSIPAMACRRVAITKITLTDTKKVAKWKCGGTGDGKCITAEDGTFANQIDCENADPSVLGCKKIEPKKPWKCNPNGEGCIESPDGIGDYSTQDECLKNCTKALTTFDCIDGKCIEQAHANGQFKTKDACETSCGNVVITPPPTPTPTPEIKKTIKEGISKKILRRLFSECDYFEIIKESNPMVYSSIQDKVKYFSPAFHSMTPEGLNARLTFLNQCVRPGQTIPVIGPDGKPKYNDARNTSFGSPPVLVLRVGDFYNTKIIPSSMGIQYEPLIYDINPEGIGVQPMIAKITMNFDFIGGHGLAGPVAQLQNALSFNYYANTEIYDERSVATESTKEKDEKIVGQIVNKTTSSVPSIPAPINNLPVPENGGSTIGTILTTENFEDGTVQTGSTEFTSIFKELSDKTNEYFKLIPNQLKKINEITNYPITQLVILNRDHNTGDLNYYDSNSKVNVEIFGKAQNIEDNIIKLFDKALKDVNDKTNPIIKTIESSNGGWSNATKRDVINNLYNIISEKQQEVSNSVVGSLNEITKFQESWIQIFRKLDLVLAKTDGYKLDTGVYKVYNLNEIPGSQSLVFDNMKINYVTNLSKNLKLFSDDLTTSQYKIINPSILTDSNTSFTPFKPVSALFFQTTETRRFYMAMSTTFTNDDKYNEFVSRLLTEKVKGNSDLVKLIEDTCKDLQIQFKMEYDLEKKRFDDFGKDESYQKFLNFKIEEFNTKLNYTTKKDNDTKDKEKLLKQTYSNQNINNDRKTFNGKITFN